MIEIRLRREQAQIVSFCPRREGMSHVSREHGIAQRAPVCWKASAGPISLASRNDRGSINPRPRSAIPWLHMGHR